MMRIRLKPRRLLFSVLTVFLLLAAAGALIALYSPAWARTWNNAVWLLLAVFLSAAAWDALQARRTPLPQIKRILPPSILQNRPTAVGLEISAPAARHPFFLHIADCLPPDWTGGREILHADILPGKTVRLNYTTVPQNRGDRQFTGIDCATPSAWGLWRYIRRLPETAEVQVLPDFAKILGEDLILLSRRRERLGEKQNRHYGSGQEFHQLRDFLDGDEIRHINWKATARAQKPIINTYRDERDRRIIFLLDCGRNMRTLSGSLSRFDRAVNALMLLSYTALKNGDSVGIATFGSGEDSYLPPQRGSGQIGRIIRQLYNRRPGSGIGDFDTAVRALLRNQPRRALVIILSAPDPGDPGQIAALRTLKIHHLPLFVSLQETAAAYILDTPPENIGDAAAYIGAQIYREDERQILQKMSALGIACLHTLPEKLNSSLLNRYLQLRQIA